LDIKLAKIRKKEKDTKKKWILRKKKGSYLQGNGETIILNGLLKKINLY
jgi:hypothetical protein